MTYDEIRHILSDLRELNQLDGEQYDTLMVALEILEREDEDTGE